MAQYANAIIAKVRALYGRMLTPAQYDELLRRQSVQEISAYLREQTPYAGALEGVQDSTIHRGQLEHLLQRDLFFQYVRLTKYVRPDEGVYPYIVADMEIGVILACLRNLISPSREREDFIASLPTYLAPYASFDLFGLAEVRSVEELVAALARTPYGPALQYGLDHFPPLESGRLRYTALELMLRTHYFRDMLRRARGTAHGEAAKQLREIVTLRAELINLSSIWRFKTYFGTPPDRIRPMLLPFRCKLSGRELDALVEARDAEAFMAELRRTAYGRHLEGDDGPIEARLGPLHYARCRHLLRFSNDPQVVYVAFMMLRTMEVEDVIRIIEGVRYGMPPERIEKLLFKKQS